MPSLTKHTATTALGALGALAVHQLAYTLAFPTGAARAAALVDHHHLRAEWSLVVPVAALATAAVVVRSIRQLAVIEAHRPTRRQLAVVTAGLFAGQEAVESLVHHELGAVVRNPAVALGLLLAPLVALALDRLLSGATELAARLWCRPGLPLPPRPTRHRAPTLAPVPAWPSTRWSPRGPPAA